MSLAAARLSLRRGRLASRPGYALVSRVLDWLLPLAAVGAGVIVGLSRSPAALRQPELYAEDGRVWFGDAYNQGWFRPLTEPHTGYLQTFPRLIAAIGLHVPLQRLPELFVDVAFAVQILPAAFIVSRRLERLVPSRAVRCLLAGLYLALPNSREVNANLTNAQWHLALLALLVVLAAPAGVAWRIADVLVVALSGLTGPFAIALVPIAAIRFVARRERWTLVLLIESAVIAATQLGELFTSSRGVYAGLGITWRRFLEIFGSEIAGGTFLGQGTQYKALSGPHNLEVAAWLLAGAVLLVLAVVVFAPLELKLFNLYSGLVLGASLADPVASVRKLQWHALAFDPQMRYWFFPTIALLADAVWLATRARPPGIAALGVALIVVASWFAIREDWSYRPLERINWVAQVRTFDEDPVGTIFVFHIAPGNWVMTLVKR